MFLSVKTCQPSSRQKCEKKEEQIKLLRDEIEEQQLENSQAVMTLGIERIRLTAPDSLNHFISYCLELFNPIWHFRPDWLEVEDYLKYVETTNQDDIETVKLFVFFRSRFQGKHGRLGKVRPGGYDCLTFFLIDFCATTNLVDHCIDDVSHDIVQPCRTCQGKCFNHCTSETKIPIAAPLSLPCADMPFHCLGDSYSDADATWQMYHYVVFLQNMGCKMKTNHFFVC